MDIKYPVTSSRFRAGSSRLAFLWAIVGFICTSLSVLPKCLLLVQASPSFVRCSSKSDCPKSDASAVYCGCPSIENTSCSYSICYKLGSPKDKCTSTSSNNAAQKVGGIHGTCGGGICLQTAGSKSSYCFNNLGPIISTPKVANTPTTPRPTTSRPTVLTAAPTSKKPSAPKTAAMMTTMPPSSTKKVVATTAPTTKLAPSTTPVATTTPSTSSPPTVRATTAPAAANGSQSTSSSPTTTTTINSFPTTGSSLTDFSQQNNSSSGQDTTTAPLISDSSESAGGQPSRSVGSSSPNDVTSDTSDNKLTSSSSAPSSLSLWAVVGVVGGGVALLFTAIVAFYFVVMRVRRKIPPEDSYTAKDVEHNEGDGEGATRRGGRSRCYNDRADEVRGSCTNNGSGVPPFHRDIGREHDTQQQYQDHDSRYSHEGRGRVPVINRQYESFPSEPRSGQQEGCYRSLSSFDSHRSSLTHSGAQSYHDDGMPIVTVAVEAVKITPSSSIFSPPENDAAFDTRPVTRTSGGGSSGDYPAYGQEQQFAGSNSNVGAFHHHDKATPPMSSELRRQKKKAALDGGGYHTTGLVHQMKQPPRRTYSTMEIDM